MFLADTLVKLKNLKLLDLRHNKMKEVYYYNIEIIKSALRILKTCSMGY